MDFKEWKKERMTFMIELRIQHQSLASSNVSESEHALQFTPYQHINKTKMID